MQVRAPAVIGRDAELAVLGRVLHAARAGQGGAAFVVGEAGIGKSRLAAAVADLGYGVGMRLLRGRASSAGPAVPFRSLAEALMSLMRAGVPGYLAELGAYRPILARLIPDLGRPPAREDGQSLAVLAEAVLRLAALAGRGHGCLLVLEDLQDADAETLAVVEYLADNLGHQPAMLLGTVRAEPSPALRLVRSACQRGSGALVELHRLSSGEVRELAASCLGITARDLPEQAAVQLWADSGGIPLLVEELLSGMLDSGLLARDAGAWRVTGPLHTRVPATLARSVSARVSQFGAQRRELLSVAAVLGQRFPLALLQAITGLGSRELLGHLHAEPTAQFVVPDDETPDWYAFRHPMIAEALLTLLMPDERGRLAGRAAAAVEVVFPGLPGEWCQVSAAFRLQAGDPAHAGRLFAEAGRRTMTQGAADSAVMLLDKALGLLVGDEDAQARAEAFAALLYALAEAGMVERAVTSAAELDQAAGLLSRQTRAQLHTRLAWAAAVADQAADGLAQVAIARRLLGPGAAEEDTAPIDVVAAHLMLALPGPDQAKEAEALARSAAAVAERVPLPLAACQAWQLLGALSRSRDPEEATACLERARHLAVLHNLPIENIHALIRLGSDDALRDGSLGRLRQARLEASRAGAITARYQAEACMAQHAILAGDFAAAETLIGQVLPAAARLRLLEIVRYTLTLKATLEAHRCRRREMDAALAELRRWDGGSALLAPRIRGLAQAWCSLLEEDRPRALAEIALALAAEEENPSYLQLTGKYGLNLFLGVLGGTAGWPEYRAITAAPVSQLRWDRQFALLARAVLAGRDGQAPQAAEAAAEAMRASAPYATARHLGLRLVSEAAIADGWGEPAEWLRVAEEYFHASKVPAVASACRALMRRAGVPVARHRQGAEDIPPVFRAAGVTVREYEVLQLLEDRLSNREIAARLHLSPRTVEKHVGSLMVKTGQPNRLALGRLGGRLSREGVNVGKAWPDG
ncbi:MAG TPA: AAA family ATPase [Streptosporangiaceae bacterium]|jgi:DNA-binding CsgD family transcriptional regulator